MLSIPRDIFRLRLFLLAFLGALTILRLWYVQTLPLSEDEANAWQWSRHLALGYYDQGPLVAWVIRLGTWAWGHTEFGVRAPAVLLSLGLSLLLYDFCRRFFKDEDSGLWLVIAVNGTILFTGGAIIHTYDTSQCFFWMLALYCCAAGIFEEKSAAWYGAGLAVGLAMLAKYTAVFFPIFLLAFLATNPRHRSWLLRPQPWFAALIAAAIFSLNIYWNATHFWTAFGHSALLASPSWNFTTFEFLGGQIGLLGPIGFVLLIIGWVIAYREARRGNDRFAYLLWLSLPVLLFFLIISVKGRAYANWPAPGYLAAVPVAVIALRPKIKNSRSFRNWSLAALISGYIFVAMILFHVPILKLLDLPADADPTQKLYGWPEMGQAIGEELQHWPSPAKPFVFSLRYQHASLAAFYTPGQPETEGLFLPDYRLNCYLFWSDPRRLRGRDGLAVVDGHPDLSLLFEDFHLLRTLELKGPAGRVINIVSLYFCQDFKGRDFRPERFLSVFTAAQ
ncbi:MAG: glycosyltransferase family 39 protein [Deltaproteobacteria bacterium]|nr:glycosyltransferase family 39 protein [Deltaproteobacteria bacterium]